MTQIKVSEGSYPPRSSYEPTRRDWRSQRSSLALHAAAVPPPCSKHSWLTTPPVFASSSQQYSRVLQPKLVHSRAQVANEMSSKLSGSTRNVGPVAWEMGPALAIRIAQSLDKGGVAVTFWQLHTKDCPHWHSGAAVLHSAALRRAKELVGSCFVDAGGFWDA